MAEKMFTLIGARLKAVRKSFTEDGQREFAERHGWEVTQWNNWETGTRRIPIDDAEKLAEAYGLTLDFIYRGRRDALSQTASKLL